MLRIPANDLTQLLLPSFDPKAKAKAEQLAKGLPASPGAAVGKLAFTAEEAVERTKAGEKVLLVRKETSPEDVDGMHSAAGILTSTGGMTSHAAVVARGWGRCCVAGAGEIQINDKARKITVAGKTFGCDDVLSIDGSTGEVMAGEVATQAPSLSGDFAKVMKWADKYRKLSIRTNADTPADAQRAREFRRRRHRPVPDGAHVLPGRPDRGHAGDDPGRNAGGPQGRVGQTAALPAQGLHRHLHRHEGTARHGATARPAVARIPAAGREDRKRKWPNVWVSSRPRSRPAFRSCTKPTRCSDIAAAA